MYLPGLRRLDSHKAAVHTASVVVFDRKVHCKNPLMATNTPAGDNSSQSTSTSLLCRVIDGDQEAWERFVVNYSTLIYARCRQRGVQGDDAADLVQEVMRSVHQSLGQFRRDGPDQGLRRWLKTIARNVITDHFRRKAREQHGLGQDVVSGLIDDLRAPNDEDTGGLTYDPGHRLMLRRILETARLDYEERTWQAFWRTAVEGQKAVDVARDLGLSDGAVRQARHKILKRLRTELNESRDLI